MPISGSGGGIIRIVTWDPATKTANVTLSNNNLTATATTGTGSTQCATTSSRTTGKYYAEFLFNTSNTPGLSQTGIGIYPSTYTLGSGSFMGAVANQWGGYSGHADIFNNGAILTNFGNTAVLDGQRVCIAFDFDNNLAWWRINAGTWNTAGDPAAGTGGVDISALSGVAKFIGFDAEALTDIFTANFGGPFTHTPPSGFGFW